MLALDIVHGFYNGTEGYRISSFEVIIVNLFYFLRCMTIGAKYACYSCAELLEMDMRLLPVERIREKLILVSLAASANNTTPSASYAAISRC